MPVIFAGLLAAVACEPVDGPWNENGREQIRLSDVARIFSELPVGTEQIGEVFDAVSGSSDNGYDEEYTMQDLFREPGSGVGDHAVKGRPLHAPTKADARTYQVPLRDMLRAALESRAAATKSIGLSASDDILGRTSPDDYLDMLQDSDIQIYWPYSQEWDWKTTPVITFDPEDGAERNIGYETVVSEDGVRSVREVVVTEEMARERPVWVINRNDDSAYTSVELMRKNEPAWGEGGRVIVTPTKAASSGMALYLKDFTMRQQGDCWFAGASEYFVKIAAVEDFRASTEAELLLYDPKVTDFMMVVRRKEIGVPREMNAVLVSNWTPQLDQCALMITEDDGGTQEKWACSAVVKWNSKSYGLDVSIPFHSRDDIVWRGQLAYKYIMACSGRTERFGDVDITFEVVEY